MLDFTDRQVVITGAASGIGAALASMALERGAEVHALDVSPIATPATGSMRIHRCDLGDPGAIDITVGGLPERIDALFNCAGIPNGGRFSGEEVMRVNWLGLRHLTERALERMGPDGAVVHIASTAGRDWAHRAEELAELMATDGFADGLAWLRHRPGLWGDGYAFSKEAVQYYTMWRAVQLLPTGIRMNSICPGVTDTAIVADFRRGLGDEVIDRARAMTGRMARPDEMAPAMLFLADPVCSSYLTGVNLAIDRGTGAARMTDQDDPAAVWGRVGG
ncbi:MAG: coniferyl-alcohol dehydrogenase [Acidimicrobiales bacterium]